MFSILFALIPSLFSVSVILAQSCDPSQLTAETFLSFLTSPNYPSNYPSSTTCEWTITAPPAYVVELSFVTFETEGYILSGSCSSSSDILEIYDGRYRSSSKLRGKYCSNYLPANVYSSGTSLYLRFTSDSYVEKRGFKLEYRAVIPRPNSTICSPFNTFFQNNNIWVSGSSGYIESPLYGDKYPSSMQCTWVITVPEGKQVKLTFSDFVVGGQSYCSSYSSSKYDHVQIKDGRYSHSTSLKTLCGQRLPSPVSSSDRYMRVQFKSNSNNNEPGSTTGFKAKYMYETLFIPTPFTTDSDPRSSYSLALVIGIVIGVCALIFLVCICVCIAHRNRTPGHVTVQAAAVTRTTNVQGTQNQQGRTTPLYPQQMQGGLIVLPPTACSSQAPQSSYPPQASGYPGLSYQHHPLPPGNYRVPATGGGTSVPGYPLQSSQSIPMVPYPQQPIPDDAPPPYPGLPAEYHLQAATGQAAPSNPNPPYPPPENLEVQQTSPPYPSATAPPPT